MPDAPTYTPGYWSNEHFQHKYDYYRLRVRYQGSTGAYMQPVAGPTQPISSSSVGASSGIVPSQMIQLESPSMRVVVAWEARRIGAKPTVPNMFPPAGSPFTLLTYDFGGENPALMEDSQTYTFELSGLYVYGLALPILPGDSFQLGAVPVQNLPASVMVVGAAQFRDTIFNLGAVGG